MIFLNKKHDDAKRNLSSMKDIIKALPPYLRFDQAFGVDGKKLKASKVGAKAFKGSPVSNVKCPKSKKKAYRKFLVKKGISKAAKFY